MFCVLLLLVASPAASAQDGERSPQELWRAFPLDPTPTTTSPGAASPDATPSTAAPRELQLDGSREDDGAGTTSLVVMLAAIALAGALAVYTGARRLSRARSERVVIPVRTRGPDPIPAPNATLWTGSEWTTCRIGMRARPIKSYFYAVPHEGGPELARSPYFKARNGEGMEAKESLDALRTLVDELTAAGWHETGAGSAPWDLRFERNTTTRALQSAQSS